MKKTYHRTKMKKSYKGFTIIEVLIVLAIAALILMIIFAAVRVIQAMERDNARKNYTVFLQSQMDQYKAQVGHYPTNVNEACDFLTNYASQNGTVTVDCTTGFSSLAHITAQTSNGYTIAFFNNDVPHYYIGPLDEIDIVMSHWCDTDPAKFGEHPDPVHPIIPITNGNLWPYDNEYDRYVIWTQLERSTQGFCVDDYPRDS